MIINNDNFLKLNRDKYFNKSGIYMLYDAVRDKHYIGSSVNLYRRISQHKTHLLQGTHFSKHLQNHVNKYGISCIEVKIIFEPDISIAKEDLRKIEQIYLDAYWGRNCFNTSKEVDNVKEYSTKKKCKNGIKNAWKNDFERMMKSIYPNTIKARAALKEKHKGYYPWLIGRIQSEEERHKRSIITKSKGRNTHVMKKIYQYSLEGNFIKEFDCITDAARTFGKKISGITQAAKQINKTAYGYKWRYFKVDNLCS